MLKKKMFWVFAVVSLAGWGLAGMSTALAQDPGVPDSLTIGNLDGTPILAGLNTQILVPVWIKTDDSVSSMHLPVATEDAYVASRDSVIFFPPLSDWDFIIFLPPDTSHPSPGYTSQSILGIADISGPPEPEDWLMTNGEWWHIADFVVTTTSDFNVLGDTTFFIEGENPINGGLLFGLPDGITEIIPEVRWGSIYFPPNNPPVFTEPQGGEIALNEQFGICLTVTATDEDNDPMVLTVDFGPTDYTWQELINEPGLISYQFCWQPPEGSAGTYPLTFTVDDGNGGVVHLDITFQVTPSELIIGSANALPGSQVSLPVSLNNQGFSSAVGAFEILASWIPSAMTLTGVTQAGRTGSFEYFFVNDQDSDEGIVRIIGIADLYNGQVSPPLQPGEGPIFFLEFSISTDEDLIGVDLPVSFLNLDETDNTISDSTGYFLIYPQQTNGIVSVVGPEDVLRGDINLNGVPYEVADVVLFVNHLVDPEAFPFDPVQSEASDVNADGIPETVADLVYLINIVNGIIPPPKVDPFSSQLVVTVAANDNGDLVRASSEAGIGAVLMSISHPQGIALTPITDGPFTLAYHDDGQTLTVLAYLPEGGGQPPGETTLFTLTPGNLGIVVNEVSGSDGSGNLLNAVFRSETPLPATYELSQNYPNPFNAETRISFGIPEAADVTLEIFSITGQKIGTLIDSYMSPGWYSLSWDGTIDGGRAVSSGVYFYRLQAGSVTKTMKMTLLK